MILGIDPGPKESAYVLSDGNIIAAHGYVGNAEIVDLLVARRVPLVRDHGPYGLPWDALVIEWIEGYGLTVGRETFDTCRWVGRFEQAAGAGYLIGRKAIKSHLCNTTQAKDRDVRAALIDRFGEPGTKKKPGPTFGITGDEWSALAVAATWADTHGKD